MSITPHSTCPCSVLNISEQKPAYKDCCQPYHEHSHNEKQSSDSEQLRYPETAEQLMRSRYSAFVLGLIDYIIDTTVPAQQSLLDKVGIANWAKQTDWAGLDVIKHTPKLGKRHAQVEFKAWYNTPDGKQAHHELSAFVKITQAKSVSRWYFIDPTLSMTLTQKQPCLCGSGEKFKRCCGNFL